MMMMGLHFTKKVPFAEVYVHALVRDEQGQKMSKSKGNVIDPLVLMDEYGADSLRMTLCSMAAQGRDIKLSKHRIEGYRNFINKIWNALKLSEINQCYSNNFQINRTKNIFNLWVLSEFEKCRGKVETSIINYKFNEAANYLYKFTWSIFCDWYLEFSKIIYLLDDEVLTNETKNITSYVLTNILIMLHPIMPFFTEHAWAAASDILKKEVTRISQSKWPKPIDIDNRKHDEINKLIDLVSSIRSKRAEMNVPANAIIGLNYYKISKNLEAIIKDHEATIMSLTKSNIIEEKEFSKKQGMVQVMYEDGLIYLSLKGIIDFNQEKNRLEKSLEKIQDEMLKIEKKLDDKVFTNKAPKNVVDEQKKRLNEYIISKEKIQKAIESIG